VNPYFLEVAGAFETPAEDRNFSLSAMPDMSASLSFSILITRWLL